MINTLHLWDLCEKVMFQNHVPLTLHSSIEMRLSQKQLRFQAGDMQMQGKHGIFIDISIYFPL